jgi:hypothetical protein
MNGSGESMIPFLSLKMTVFKDNVSKHNSKNQEDAGDDNCSQTYYSVKETRNYSVYLFKTDDVQKLLNCMLGYMINDAVVLQESED